MNQPKRKVMEGFRPLKAGPATCGCERDSNRAQGHEPAPARILMTADTVGGVWTYAVSLATALASGGIQIALATMGERLRTDQASEVAAIPNLELYESEYKLEWMPDPWQDLEAAGGW